MEKNQENEKLRTDKEKEHKFDVLECPEEDPGSNKSISCHEPSIFCKDSEDKVVLSEKDVTEDQKRTFEDVEECLPGRNDEDDNLDTEEEDDDDEERDEADEEKQSVDLAIEDELMDTFFEEEPTEDSIQTIEEQNTVAEREPIVFGVISELLPVCVVTLDIKTKGSTNPCYDLRELLKQRLWTHSDEVLEQLIILYNLFSTSDTRLQMIDCKGAVQLHVQAFSFNAIENFFAEVQSGRFNDVLACMLISYHMQEKMKKLNAEIDVTCHCESLNQWYADYKMTLHSFYFYQRMPVPYGATDIVDWPSESSFSLVQTEIDRKLSIATVFNDHISEDFMWDESNCLEQRSKDGGGKSETGKSEVTTPLAADDEPRSSSHVTSKPLISGSLSIDNPSSKCDSDSDLHGPNQTIERDQVNEQKVNSLNSSSKRGFIPQESSVLIIGDSIIRDISRDDFANGIVKVKCIREATVNDVNDELKIDDYEYSHIVIHVGTNDVAKDSFRKEDFLNEIEELITTTKVHRGSSTSIILSGPCPRSDEFSQSVKDINTAFKEQAAKLGCAFIENFTSFADHDGHMDTTLFATDGVHLSKKGAQKLRENVTAIPPICLDPRSESSP